jgi:Cys-tRNA(Pro) deacylase
MADYPVTRGVRLLSDKKIPFEPHLYPYEEPGPSRLGTGPSRLGTGPSRLGTGPSRLGTGPSRAGTGTEHAAACLKVDEHRIVKTLVMESESGKPFLVLMHGDREVSTKNLARALGVKTVSPCQIDKAERVTGYQVGGISPFGTRQPLPVYVERTILELDTLYINGGKRGFLVEIAPAGLRTALPVREVEVAITP